ncbi:phosphoribosyl-ATP diphosphatase [Sphingopyxis sp.]|uniref:phosphoribosyl-ATP diphosphatase n=1 Tax=Sphingopyxis sp. TaxID=1908224 RepID=UPI001DF8210D|nr:phosphoribosyl-ATP diphosphatase [Sphingopyxis sp.]MBW8296913.1 phosphoribosyl-ATP diphosphatase [Sphingopyxis sp.]
MSKAMGEALGRLEAVIHDRLAAGEAEDSYVASLAAKGRGKIAQKLGEEAVEAVIAAVSEDDPALIGEASDLVFHLAILLAERGIAWDAIAAELARRHGTSGHTEKASRQS